VLRSSAHFGVSGLLIPSASGLALSGAACRVAEGGAEQVPVVSVHDVASSLGLLEQAGFTLAATLPRDAAPVYTTVLPERLVWVFGAEQTGMSAALLKRCSLRVGIPGSGAVESLNIASAAAVMLSEWRRRYPQP
jgi:TrmH RNA methyltransferase